MDGGAGLSVELVIGALATRSQSLIVKSLLPEAIVRPSGEKATDSTLPVCPCSVRSCRPLATPQSLMALAKFPEAIVRLSGEKATEYTGPVSPCSVRSSRPLAASQSLIKRRRNAHYLYALAASPNS